MAAYVFHSGKFLDPRKTDLQDGIEVLIEGDRIKEVADRPINAAGATRIDLHGRTLMPGLIDAHVHLFLAEVNLALLEGMPLTLLTTKAVVNARNMLMRGFTTVRDTGGCDHGTKLAAETGIIDSPRLFISGMPISQTGGHADFVAAIRRRSSARAARGLSYMSRIADGVPEMIKAVRDELRKGADLGLFQDQGAHLSAIIKGGHFYKNRLAS
jgi:imidazolonepropionase-like amidohydrolase